MRRSLDQPVPALADTRETDPAVGMRG
jgi:hypothetical protein